MDTLDRYLVRETTTFLVLILLGLALLFLGIDFLTNFWRSSLPISTITMTYLYRVPAAIQQFVPVACLMASLLVLTSMSRQNELLALYTSGVGTVRILSTFVAMVAVVSTASFLLFDPLVPIFTRKQILVSKGLDPASSDNLSSFNHSNCWYRSGRLIYNFGQFLPQTNTLKDIKIYRFAPSFYLMESIHARESHFDRNDWVLHDGTVVTYPAENQYPLSVAFTTKHNVIPDQPKDFKSLEIRDDTMRLRDLREYIKKNHAFGLDTTTQQVNYHERVALVFTPLVLVLLGFPFALRPLKTHSSARSVAFCFGIVFAYLLISRLTLSVGKGGHIPPVVSAWAPNLLFVGIALFRLLRN